MRRLLLGLLARTLPADWRDDIVRDLEEAHARRVAARGRIGAEVWLAGQTLLFAGRFVTERTAERMAALTGSETVASWMQDIRLSLRSLGASPLFLAAIVVTLGVGIGANTAIFSVVRAVLLAPLPYPEGERLVVLDPYPWVPASIVVEAGAGVGLETLAGYYPRRFAVTGGEGAVEMEGAVVTPEFFDLLGARVAAGRGFVPGDAEPGAERVAVLSHGAWQRHLGGAEDAVGRTLRLDARPHVVVGVLAPGFRQLTPGVDDPGVWTAGALDALGADVLPEDSQPWVIPVARLPAGGDRTRADVELEAAVDRWVASDPEAGDAPRPAYRWTPLRTQRVEGVRSALVVLQGAVGLVLLLACVNVANLLLVRFSARRTEVAIRTALGASRARVLRQLLTESMVLALVGGAAGLLWAGLSLELVVALAPDDLPRVGAITLDGVVLLFTLGVSLATGVLFGVLPGLATTREGPHRALKEDQRGSTGSRASRRLGQGLVVAQVTLTLVLVVGAGLLVQSFLSLSGQAPGFRSEGVVVLRVAAPEHRYVDGAALESYQRDLLAALAAEPGVASVALANNIPLSRGNSTRQYVVEGETEPRIAEYGVVSPDYFATLDIPLERGRALETSDARGAPRVAVVDASMAREAWPGLDPVGRRFRFVDDDGWMTVVGVSAAVRGSGLARAPEPGFHIPYTQRPGSPVELGVGASMVILVRARGSVAELPGALREAVWAVEAGQPVPDVQALDDLLAGSTTPERFRAVLVGAFAAVALLLAVAGIYGVVGHLLAVRTHELGIRRALGADHRDVVGQVLGWGLRLAGAGLALGVLVVLWTGRFLEGLLFGVTAGDPVTIGMGAAAVLGATLLACAIPAWRATRIAALGALRAE